MKQNIVRATVNKLQKNVASKATLNTVVNLDKKFSQAKLPTIQAVVSLGSNSLAKEETNKENRPLVYLLNEILDEKDPVPLPVSSLIS